MQNFALNFLLILARDFPNFVNNSMKYSQVMSGYTACCIRAPDKVRKIHFN